MDVVGHEHSCVCCRHSFTCHRELCNISVPVCDDCRPHMSPEGRLLSTEAEAHAVHHKILHFRRARGDEDAEP